jgi:positive regulator of sigma E activity
MKEKGFVISKNEKHVEIGIPSAEECHKCARCRAGATRNIRLPLRRVRGEVRKGDVVEVSIPDKAMLGIYILFYVLPLVVFLAGLFSVYLVTSSPLAGFIAGFILLLLSYVAVGVLFRGRDMYMPVAWPAGGDGKRPF